MAHRSQIPRAGLDMVMQAHCGWSIAAGGTGNPPLCCRSPLVDFATGRSAPSACWSALERLKSGRALAVETNLLNVGTHMFRNSSRARWHFAWGTLLDHTQTGFKSAESLYQTADGGSPLGKIGFHGRCALAGVGDSVARWTRGLGRR